MKITFKQLVESHYGVLTEELHQELKDVLNAPETDRSGTSGKLYQRKLTNFSAKVKDLSKRGEDTGLEGGTPKRGSSRAVYFPTEPKHITIDGAPAQQHTAVKVAFAGALDKHTGDSHLLGEHQNIIESDHFTRDNHSMLRHTNDHHYEYNPDGVTAPVLDHHEDGHWLEMAHADKLTGKKFTELTKTESHPKGLKFDHFHEALKNDHAAAHGEHSGTDDHDHLREHPLYQNTQDFIYNTGNHPVDLRLQSMGVWRHPVTGKEHPVIRDYGYSNDIAKLYSKGGQNSMKANRGW
jgi:hypothetical protein